MRVVLPFIASMALICGSAAAQTDEIALYSDAEFTNCELVDSGGGIATVYVVHHIGSGAIASQFMVRPSSGMSMTHLGDNHKFQLVIGDSQSGMAVAYQSCLSSDVLVTEITYLKSGMSSNCSSLQVVPDPGAQSGTIKIVDCSDYWVEGTGTRLVVNPSGSCACGPTTEITNWGRIKDRFSD